MEPFAAGPFLAWLSRMRRVLDGLDVSDVPCGDCVACCASSHFVHIEPDEPAARAIPRKLQFPAPGLPKGHKVLGFDEAGRCPMLGAGCTVYIARPRTCARYDCRVFAAAGIPADREAITARSSRWVFDYPTPADRAAHDAILAAARAITGQDPVTTALRAVREAKVD